MLRILLTGWLAAALTILPGAAPVAAQEAQTIRLASTTSVDNSGLLAAILPQFIKATGINVQVLAQGTGQALDTARRGDADLVLVHDPEAEQKFIDEGYGVKQRQIAWNDFIVVGPEADLAKIKGSSDAVAAFQAIAIAKAAFISRGDRSGTNALELRLWKAAGIDPKSGSGSWYRDIGGPGLELISFLLHHVLDFSVRYRAINDWQDTRLIAVRGLFSTVAYGCHSYNSNKGLLSDVVQKLKTSGKSACPLLIEGLRLPEYMTGTHLENCLIGYAHVSTWGKRLTASLSRPSLDAAAATYIVRRWPARADRRGPEMQGSALPDAFRPAAAPIGLPHQT